MPADDHAAEIDVLRRRYPRWTIWFGLFTGHWWALPPQDRDVGDFVEAESAAKLVARIEVIQHSVTLHGPRRNERRPSRPRRPESGASPQLGRIPAGAWPGGVAR